MAVSGLNWCFLHIQMGCALPTGVLVDFFTYWADCVVKCLGFWLRIYDGVVQWSAAVAPFLPYTDGIWCYGNVYRWRIRVVYLSSRWQSITDIGATS